MAAGGASAKRPRVDQLKGFNDSLHGHMEFHPLCVAIINTPEFDRLRYLKQLGAGYFVYPGASHNRFEHSLGVCFLAGQLVNHLKSTQPELEISEEDALCVQIAGLCHDLGHGPFSHAFDNKFIPKIISKLKGKLAESGPETEKARGPKEETLERGIWKHEQASIKMFDHLVEKNHLEQVFDDYNIKEDRRKFIKELICEEVQKTRYYGQLSDKAFLYEIVANKSNCVDVDKWDYFKRDSQHLGMTTSFDHTRCIKLARVIKADDGFWHICFRDKEAFNMYDMFRTRHALHCRAYQHKTVQAVELMLVEAFEAADGIICKPGKDGKMWTISGCIEDMDAYSQLTDGLFHEILFSQDPGLKKAQGFLQDIQKRKLFRLVAETQPLSGDKTIEKTDEEITKEIGKFPGLKSSTFIVQVVKLDYGMKDENPVDKIWFYTKNLIPFKVPASEVSCFVPQSNFKEQVVRVFLIPTKNKEKTDEENGKTDKENAERLSKGFRKWCEKNGLDVRTKSAFTPAEPEEASAHASGTTSTTSDSEAKPQRKMTK